MCPRPAPAGLRRRRVPASARPDCAVAAGPCAPSHAEGRDRGDPETPEAAAGEAGMSGEDDELVRGQWPCVPRPRAPGRGPGTAAVAARRQHHRRAGRARAERARGAGDDGVRRGGFLAHPQRQARTLHDRPADGDAGRAGAGGGGGGDGAGAGAAGGGWCGGGAGGVRGTGRACPAKLCRVSHCAYPPRGFVDEEGQGLLR